MELHKFIKESVREVIKGMAEAETDTHKFGINNDNYIVEFVEGILKEIK